MEAAKGVVSKTGEVLHKAVDATILDKSPHGTNVDGFIDTSKEVQAVANATVLDTHEKIVEGGIDGGKMVTDAGAAVAGAVPHGK